MPFEIRYFGGICSKTNEFKQIPILYRRTCDMTNGNCLERFTFKCEISKYPECPIFQNATQILPSNG